MRFLFAITCLFVFLFNGNAQEESPYYLSLLIGPKMAFHQLNGDLKGLEIKNDISAGFGVEVGRFFNKDYAISAGLIQNNYSSKVLVNTHLKNMPEQEILFETMENYRLFVLGSKYLRGGSQKWRYHIGVGFNWFVFKKPNTDNLLLYNVYPENSGANSTDFLDMRIEGVSLGHNVQLLGNGGAEYYLNDQMAMSIQATFRYAFSPIYSAQIRYISQEDPVTQYRQAQLTNNGIGVDLLIGFRFYPAGL